MTKSELSSLCKHILDWIHLSRAREAECLIMEIAKSDRIRFEKLSSQWMLLESAYAYEVKSLIPALVEKGARGDANESRAFRLAASDGDTALCKLLLDAGAVIFDCDNYAIIRAIENKHQETARFLIDSGAFCHFQCVQNLCASGDLELLRFAHKKNAIGDCETSARAAFNLGLVEAVKSRQDEVVGWLLENGADFMSNNGHILNVVLEQGDQKMIAKLVRHGLHHEDRRLHDAAQEYPLIGAWIENQRLLMNGNMANPVINRRQSAI